MQTHGPHSHTGQCGWEASQQASVGSAHPRWGPSARRFPRTVSGTRRAGPRQVQRAARALISERPGGCTPGAPRCRPVRASTLPPEELSRLDSHQPQPRPAPRSAPHPRFRPPFLGQDLKITASLKEVSRL